LSDITFPAGGIDKSTGFHQQPPYTAADALNVRTIDVFANRARGGSRPGWTKHYASAFGSGNPVRALTRMVNNSGVALLVNVTNGGLNYETSSGTWSTGFSTMSNSGRICVSQMGTFAFFAQTGVTNPHFYDIATNNNGAKATAPADVATLGNVPDSVNIVATHLSRLYFAGNTTAPRTYYASKVDDHTNWLYSGTGNTRAFTGSYTPAGNTNDKLTALIPWVDDKMLFCGRTSMRVLYGDPLDRGYFLDYSPIFGCLDSMSWCRGPNGMLFILSREGLLACQPGAPPELISTKKLRQELVAVDTASYEPVLNYDPRQQGVNIFITKTSSSAGVNHWFYDVRRSTLDGAFWRENHHVDVEPFCACQYPELTATHSTTLYGTRTGHIRRFDDSTATDDGNNFSSNVWLGPFDTARDGSMDGYVWEVIGRLAEASGAAGFSIHIGDTADAAAAAAAFATFPLSAGCNLTNRPNLRCATFYIKVFGTAGTRWAMEKLTVNLDRGSALRL
jgi:hypothetical protein